MRKKKHDFMLRVFDAAALLGVDAVCGFVGRNQKRSMDQNLVDFEEQFVPLLKEAKARGLTYRVEQCPMPGWTTVDNFHNNIAYTPGTWIALHRICEKHGVGDQFRIHYDPSHAILMGQDTRSIFQYLKDTGYNFLIGGFHVKGQVIDAEGRGRPGATAARRSSAATGRTASRRRIPADQLNAWKKQIVLCRARAARARRGTIRWPICRTARSTGSITSSPRASCCSSTWRTRTWSSSTSIPQARIQDKERLKPILQGSIAFVRHIDEAAACMYALQHEVLARRTSRCRVSAEKRIARRLLAVRV